MNCKSVTMFVLFLGLLVSVVGHGLITGDKCTTPKGESGTCKGIRACDSAIQQILKMAVPTLCNTKDFLVCCVEVEPKTMASNKENTRSREKYKPNYKEECDSLSTNITTPMRKSLQSKFCIIYFATKPEQNWTRDLFFYGEKCLEYQEKLLFPCQDSLTPNEGKVRAQNCNWKPEGLIIGGMNSYLGEFPHMALLGYGRNDIIYKCSGIIVSDRFILTAGHCTYSRGSGKVTKVRIAFLQKSEKTSEMTEYDIMNIYKHPRYKPPVSYHDIALLKTDRIMQLSQFAVPACLHDGSPINDTAVFATGWGTTQFMLNTNTDILQKVTLDKFSDAECLAHSQSYPLRSMPQGYDQSKQLCYGHRNFSRDTCKGDSGGPLQIKHPEISCMYLINAIISNGKWCGVPRLPGFYTRISAYLDWIESIVWP